MPGVKSSLRHDCGNVECVQYRKQMVLDATFMVAQVAIDAMDQGVDLGPLDLIEHAVSVMKGKVAHDGLVAQAQQEKNGQMVH